MSRYFLIIQTQILKVLYLDQQQCVVCTRQRLDLSVNILTNFAVNKGMIKVFGGDQLRPNLHVMDYSDAVQVLIEITIKENTKSNI